ncbi:methanol oxidation system protein MoxJ [Dokdonella koreensis]|uniref:MxaJ, protein involved in methanol oxidation n=1 Tax=Dokdonella koreensis DS-123 TaxID=1300342 RepID=A0A167GQE1_9GAMM|nr:methanol oxidation system protein MoxJ [Dokdonella koreensis]ANB17096.1 MxaJ, protein involved in methanol oxidation [Dokdonella koreensis DS-123]
MPFPLQTRLPRAFRIAGCLLLGLVPLQAAAAPAELRICASEIEAPYSYKDGSGFENRIAEVVAAQMGRKATFVWSPRAAIYLVRDALDKNECDVVMGLDTGDERVLTTRPYYRAGYVLVTRADRELEIGSWSDPRLAAMGSIAMGFASSAEAMMKKIGKYEDNANYVYSLVDFKSRRNQYLRVDPARMVNEVAQGKADAAIAFAPEVARYVKASTIPLHMQTVPADDTGAGEPIPFQFDQSMAVRKGDQALLDALNDALVKAAPQIRKVLGDEGIPFIPAAS